MDPFEQLSAIQSGAQIVLDQVAADHLGEPCPCDGWDVATLTDKMVTSGLLFAALCRGEQPDPHLNLLFPTDVGRASPSASFRAAADECESAFRTSALEGEMMGPLGVHVPRRAGLNVRMLDCAINTWDLARAIGVSVPTDPSAVEPLIGFAEGFLVKVRERDDHVRFAAPVRAAPNAGPIERVVAISGRDIHWQAREAI